MTVLLPVLDCVYFFFEGNNCAFQNCAFGESRNRSGQKAVKRGRRERGREAKLAKNASKRRNLSFLIAHAASFQKGGRGFPPPRVINRSDRVGTGV